ncbi:flagellin [Phenylobacterium deserti]|uniref:Flagellin n=1 Tax=Phenylobacterium deserti TaxID=1914756 RepID=A0A328AAA1_9CAUL|nr:flagellin [Phenylobacterium deserti]RAK51485.1 flagellin [Phenylobacterium deserti]
MVARISTTSSYNTVLANLMVAQQNQLEAGEQVGTQKKGKDLKDFATSAEMLTAMRTVQARVKMYQEQNSIVADRLATQDAALNQITDAAGTTRQSIADAIAAGRADALMEDIKAQLRNAIDGLNTRYNGKFLFAGGQIETKPVSAQSMAELTSGPVASFLHNDEYKAQAKLDDSTTVGTGFLASELGEDLLAAYQAIQAFEEGPDGPFNGKLTTAQSNFLQSQLATWDTVRTDLTALTAQNGLAQKQVKDVAERLVTRDDAVKGMIGDVTDADMAMAATQLQMAQIAVQASAQVFMTLQSSSLLNLLK